MVRRAALAAILSLSAALAGCQSLERLGHDVPLPAPLAGGIEAWVGIREGRCFTLGNVLLSTPDEAAVADVASPGWVHAGSSWVGSPGSAVQAFEGVYLETERDGALWIGLQEEGRPVAVQLRPWEARDGRIVWMRANTQRETDCGVG